MVRKEDLLRRFACRQQERDGKELLVEVTACAELAPDFRRTLTDGFDVGGGFQPACPAAAGVTVVCRDVFDNFGTVFCAVGFAGGVDGDNAVFRAGADVVVENRLFACRDGDGKPAGFRGDAAVLRASGLAFAVGQHVDHVFKHVFVLYFLQFIEHERKVAEERRRFFHADGG